MPNELSKKELIWLHETLEWIVEDFREPDSTYALKDKIQSMIDNYCEHAETENIGGWVSKCVKCGMKFGDETQ